MQRRVVAAPNIFIMQSRRLFHRGSSLQMSRHVVVPEREVDLPGIGAFELGKAGDRVRIAGIADPSSFLEGLPRDALGERVSLLVDGDLTFDQIANARQPGLT